MQRIPLFFFSVETLLLLLFAFTEPIVCPGVEMFTTRRVRSSKIDTSEYISDNLHSMMENETTESRSGKEPEARPVVSPNINETIFAIFDTDNSRTFNNTYATPPYIWADEPFDDNSSKQEQEFNVKRTPDGKLNLVFNEFYIFQKAEALNPHTTTRTEWVTPTEWENIQEKMKAPAPDVPTCAGGDFNLTSICTEVLNLPKAVAGSLQEQYSKFELFFGVDYTPPIVTSRINTPSEESLCDSDDKTVFPKSGVTINNEMRWIVNRENYTQGIRVEKCRNEGKPCNRLQGSLQNGYKATCKQNYSYRPMVAESYDGSNFIEQIKIPSCCKCVLTQKCQSLRNGPQDTM